MSEALNDVTMKRRRRIRWDQGDPSGDPINRTVIVEKVPMLFNSQTLSTFLCGAICALQGKPADSLNTFISSIKEITCEDAQLNVNDNNSTVHNIYSSNTGSKNGSSSFNHGISRTFRVELQTIIYTLLCLKLNGIPIGTSSSKLICRRPKEYIPPPKGDPLNTFQIVLDKPESKQVSTEKCILKDLPIDISEESLRKQLETIGPIKTLIIIYDPITGVPKGVGSFEFEDSLNCNKAVEKFHGRPIEGTKNGVWNIQLSSGILAKSNNNVGLNSTSLPISSPTPLNQASVISFVTPREYKPVTSLTKSMSHKLLSSPIIGLILCASKKVGETPSKVVQLLNIIQPEELLDDQEYHSILDSVKTEAEKFGTILEIFSPRPKSRENLYCNGAGKIFIYFADITSARRAQYQLNGRIFDHVKTVCASFFPLEKYLNREYSIVNYTI
ncbi:RNA recognition motif family protein [Cryptosporidium serpentis]